MRKYISAILVLFLFAAIASQGQVKRITFPANSPEDKALQAISAEPDTQKRIQMTEEFIAKFASNNDAVAYGNLQLAQTYQGAGQNDKALAFGEKALALAPGNIEILVALAGIADSAKDTDKVIEYAVKGGTAYNGIASAPKPADVTAESWANDIAREQASFKQSYEYLEAAAYNAINAEPAAKKRLQFVEQFTAAFPKSRFEEPMSQLTLAALQDLNDRPQAIAFGEKLLKRNPNSVATLMMLANVYIEDPQTLEKAITLSAKAVKLAKIDENTPSTLLAAGMARSTYGYALLRADRTLESVPELKRATELLEGNTSALAEALYRLGFSYAKLGKRPEAKQVLEKCLTIQGPYESYAKELLEKVNAPVPKRK